MTPRRPTIEELVEDLIVLGEHPTPPVHISTVLEKVQRRLDEARREH